jgi:toxin FitB
VSDVALDTSVAVPYVLASHVAHDVASRHLAGRTPALTGHSLAETYSVLTRLPADARLAPAQAVELIDANFELPVLVPSSVAVDVHGVLAPLGIAGGAVYDALVALAAREADLPLATRDRRAAATYAALQVRVELIA